MACKHYELMKQYLQTCAEHAEPWKLWQVKMRGNWGNLVEHPLWSGSCEYRIKPKTILINGFSVPDPMREKPEYGTRYWYINVNSEDGVSESTWTNANIDNIRLGKGVCHLSRDNCIIHAEALFSFSEVK